MASVKDEAQLGMDEEVVEDDELEALLDARLKRKNSRDALTKEFKAAHELVIGALGRLELEDGQAVRIGQHRITKSAIPARSVSFEVAPSSRIRIGLWSKDEGDQSTGTDEADVRPAGPVNADALRGEVERATLPEPTSIAPGGRNAGRNAARGPLPPVN